MIIEWKGYQIDKERYFMPFKSIELISTLDGWKIIINGIEAKVFDKYDDAFKVYSNVVLAYHDCKRTHFFIDGE